MVLCAGQPLLLHVTRFLTYANSLTRKRNLEDSIISPIVVNPPVVAHQDRHPRVHHNVHNSSRPSRSILTRRSHLNLEQFLQPSALLIATVKWLTRQRKRFLPQNCLQRSRLQKSMSPRWKPAMTQLLTLSTRKRKSRRQRQTLTRRHKHLQVLKVGFSIDVVCLVCYSPANRNFLVFRYPPWQYSGQTTRI